MKWRALDALAPLLASRFDQEQFHFKGDVLSGQKEMRPRWMRCNDAVAGQPGADSLGEIVGQVFIQQRFGADAKTRMNELITALQRSLRHAQRPRLDERRDARTGAGQAGRAEPEDWRARHVARLQLVTIKRDDYAGNLVRIATNETQRQLHWIGQPVDRSLWLMTPQTVNAYLVDGSTR